MTEYTLFGHAATFAPRNAQHYLLREPVQLFQRLDERGAERHATYHAIRLAQRPSQLRIRIAAVVDRRAV